MIGLFQDAIENDIVKENIKILFDTISEYRYVEDGEILYMPMKQKVLSISTRC